MDRNKFLEFYGRNYKRKKPNYSSQEIIFILEHLQLHKGETLLKKEIKIKS